jgi:general secretion pathway protein B
MSYILEALKRADAERERETAGVPGLHAQARDFDEGDADLDAAYRGQRKGWALGGLLGVVTLGTSGWFFWPREVPPVAVAAVAPQIVVPSPSPPPVPVPAPPPLAVAQPNNANAPMPLPQMAPVPPLPTLAPPPETPPRVRSPQPDTPKPKAQPKDVNDPTAAALQEPRIYRVNELPDNIRQELPSLSLGGVMYSDQASSRMVVVNGQVFREGDTLALNVLLKQIKLKEAVLEFKGYRYGVKY